MKLYWVGAGTAWPAIVALAWWRSRGHMLDLFRPGAMRPFTALLMTQRIPDRAGGEP